MFSIMIENLLHFLEYFDDKMIFMKNFPLGCAKVRFTHISFVFLHKCGKIWKRKDCANVLCHLESSRSPCSKMLQALYNMVHIQSCCSKITD